MGVGGLIMVQIGLMTFWLASLSMKVERILQWTTNNDNLISGCWVWLDLCVSVGWGRVNINFFDRNRTNKFSVQMPLNSKSACVHVRRYHSQDGHAKCHFHPL